MSAPLHRKGGPCGILPGPFHPSSIIGVCMPSNTHQAHLELRHAAALLGRLHQMGFVFARLTVLPFPRPEQACTDSRSDHQEPKAYIHSVEVRDGSKPAVGVQKHCRADQCQPTCSAQEYGTLLSRSADVDVSWLLLPHT
jgi:hypothetical protein